MENNITIKDNSVMISVNPDIYTLETIYSASYVFLDRAYILLDGDPKKEILISLQPKKQEDLQKLGGEFLNELINYSDYKKRAEQTKEIREMLLQRAIITNDPSSVQNHKEFEEIIDDSENGELDDIKDIAIPWEEKYGNKKNNECKPKKDENKTK